MSKPLIQDYLHRAARASTPLVADLGTDHVQTLHGLGSTCLQRGDMAGAVRCLSAIPSHLANAAMLHDLALAHHQSGNAEQACLHYQAALGRDPCLQAAHANLGVLLHGMGRYSQARDHYQKALLLNEQDANTHSNLALLHHQLGAPDLAIACAQAALALQPSHYSAWVNLGVIQRQKRHWAKAQACFEKAIALQPGRAKAHSYLALVLDAQGQGALARQHATQAVLLEPQQAENHINLGVILTHQCQFGLAEQHLEQAVLLEPDNAKAHAELGVVRYERGDANLAIDSYRQALRLHSDADDAHSNLLFALSAHPDCPAERYLEQARQYGQRLRARAPTLVYANPPRHARLRVGLISGDLRTHAVGYFLAGLMAANRSQQLEWIAYSNHECEDNLSMRLKGCFASWVPIYAWDDLAVAERIRADGIHILIDLAGHTAYNRLPVFALKPAPIQVSWLGYWASTGLDTMDYLIADHLSLPPERQGDYCERIQYLPHLRYCFTPPDGAPAPTEPPAQRNRHPTLGSFQPPRKITDQVLGLWCAVLGACPDTHLRLQHKAYEQDEARARILGRLGNAGIAAARVCFAPHGTREDYLRAYSEVDFVLDTHPYTGGTTTCEALWMGVPTLTLAGTTMLGRQGLAILDAVGLREWVAESERDYIEKAVRFAHDMPYLRQLRTSLRERMHASPLCDAATFAKDLEQLLLRLWDHHAGRSSGAINDQ